MLPAFILSFSAMTIQIAKESRKEAIASIERYCRENFPEPVSGLEADGLLSFFLEEIARWCITKPLLMCRNVCRRG
jgi:hypothetical protein